MNNQPVTNNQRSISSPLINFRQFLLASLSPCLFLTVLLLSACSMSDPEPPVRPTAAFLPGTGDRLSPQPTFVSDPPTPSPSPALATTRGLGVSPVERQIVEIRIQHVRDLSEILVQVGEAIEVGQVLARLEGYAQELERDVRLAEEQLEEARARLIEARGDLARSQQEAISEQEQGVAEAASRVESLERRVKALGRQEEMAEARLAMARAKTEYHRRWLKVLEPLGEFDPWGDLPYLVGVQSGPQGKRSDLAYREALARAEYDLRMAELEQTIAGLEVTDAAAQLHQAEADLKAARATLARIQAAPVADSGRPGPDIHETSVRISELRLAQARAGLEETVVKSLVAGKVLAVRVDRVVGNEAVVVIRIATGR